MDFKTWLELQGCVIEVTQEDDGSGYECWTVTTPDGTEIDLTVTS